MREDIETAELKESMKLAVSLKTVRLERMNGSQEMSLKSEGDPDSNTGSLRITAATQARPNSQITEQVDGSVSFWIWS